MNLKQYRSEVLNDAKEWLEENIEYYSNFEDAYYDMQLQITGNDVGSYYINSAKAEESVKDVLFDYDAQQLIMFHLGIDQFPLTKGSEACDVILRIAVLQDQYSDVEDIFEELKAEY